MKLTQRIALLFRSVEMVTTLVFQEAVFYVWRQREKNRVNLDSGEDKRVTAARYIC